MQIKLHPKATETFNSEAEALLLELTPAPLLKPQPGAFMPDMPIVANISRDQMVGPSISGLDDPAGNQLARYFAYQDKRIGFEGASYKKLAELGEKLQSKIRGENGERNIVSSDYVLDQLFRWVYERYVGNYSASMCDYFVDKCGADITDVEIMIPIALTSTQSELRIGNVTIKNLSSKLLDDWEKYITSQVTDVEIQDDMHKSVSHIRHDHQGKAVALVRTVAEPRQAFDTALAQTEDALALLRIFTAANLIPGAIAYCAPWGQEKIDQYRYFVVNDLGYPIREASGVISSSQIFLTLSDTMLSGMREGGLDIVINLYALEKKSEFQRDLLDSLLLYSRHTIAKTLSDKVFAIFGALDSFLLKDENESIQQNIADRIAFLIGRNAGERQHIVETIKKAYGLRSSFVHHAKSIKNTQLVQELLMLVWRFYVSLLFSHDKIPTKQHLLTELDKRKYM